MVLFGIEGFPIEDIRGLMFVGAMRVLRPVGTWTRGVSPVMGESPGAATEIGVNMVRFVPGIIDMLRGVEPTPGTERYQIGPGKHNNVSEACLVQPWTTQQQLHSSG